MFKGLSKVAYEDIFYSPWQYTLSSNSSIIDIRLKNMNYYEHKVREHTYITYRGLNIRTGIEGFKDRLLKMMETYGSKIEVRALYDRVS